MAHGALTESCGHNHVTFLCCQHVVGCQKVKGFKAVHVEFQGLFVAGRGQRSVAHGIVDLTPQEADGAAHLKHSEKKQNRGEEMSHNYIATMSSTHASSFDNISFRIKFINVISGQ